MHPVLVTLGGFEVHAYGALAAVGFLVAVFVMLRRARQSFLHRDKVVDVVFWTAVAALIGSRALFVFQHLDQLPGIGAWLDLRSGGLVFYGALLAGLPVAGLMIWRHRLPFFLFMDVAATALPLGHGISRIGCLLAGCCYGTPTALPWGVVFDEPLSDAPSGVALHPTQLYSALVLFGIAGATNWLFPRRRFDGQVMLVYLLMYAGARFGLEFLRGDPGRGWFLEPVFGQALSVSQGTSILVAVAALIVFFVVAQGRTGGSDPA